VWRWKLVGLAMEAIQSRWRATGTYLVCARDTKQKRTKSDLRTMLWRWRLTEAEWLAETNPELVLGCLRKRGSDRKRRLFAVGCCRGVWGWLDPRSRHAVEVAERLADGLEDQARLIAAVRAALATRPTDGDTPEYCAYRAAFHATRVPSLPPEVQMCATWAIQAVDRGAGGQRPTEGPRLRASSGACSETQSDQRRPRTPPCSLGRVTLLRISPVMPTTITSCRPVI
jgi:hypothetical protein